MASSQQEGVDFKTPTMDELLRISIKLSDSERMHEAALNETGEFTVSPEDQAWLKDAMGMTQKSDAERMKEALAIINDAADTQPHKEYALDLILFAVEDIDNAGDFVKFDGGLSTLLRLLDDREHATMRLGAAWLLGTLTQNNPKAQAAVLAASAEIANKLAALSLSDPEVEVRRKALLALSSLARNSEAGQAAFLAAGGATLPSALLSEPSPDSNMTTRGLFLAAHLVGEAPERFVAPFSEAGVAPLCCGLIGASGGDWDGEDLDLREQALRLLLALATATTKAAEGATAARAAVGAAAAAAEAKVSEHGVAAASADAAEKVKLGELEATRLAGAQERKERLAEESRKADEQAAAVSAGPEPLQAQTRDALREAVAARASEVGGLEGDEKEWRMTELEMGAELLAALGQ